ncbi:heavy metal transporter [Actinoplanes sp. ATCC 53533]|uniref:heavy-metal-associated domain-containing protein n=1 Tax=Actinoplanes sp. ATCC 53533 TaxID=1288362 RepID=UPI000F7B9A5D|nr:cation transporter [Actinoplanes sp. ATCC 53533]RSM62039.1 heavy metal transporter [Actinoplanes sp. ATCC 53533]
MSTTTYTLTVTGMHCGSCGLLIDEAIEETAGVHRSHTSVRAGRTVVDADPTVIDHHVLIAVIGTLGYTARLEPA